MKLSNPFFWNFKSSYPRQLCRARNELRYHSDLLTEFLSECSDGPKFLTCYVHRMLRRTQGDRQTVYMTPYINHFTDNNSTGHARYLLEKLANAMCLWFIQETVLQQLPRIMQHILICRHQRFQYLVLTLKNALTWNKWYSEIFSLSVAALEARPVQINSAKSGSICTLFGAGQLSLPKMVCTFYCFCCFLPCRLCRANESN